MSQLSDLVDPSAISLDASAQDWRAAIRLSGDLLVSTESTTSSYTDAMIRTVEEHGPYIVIAPGFALAHARPDESVLRTALSFVRLAEPIPFGNEANDPVTLVMALAAADASAHQSALAALAGVLADPTSRRELDTASTPAEVLAALGADDADAAEGADTSTDADTDARHRCRHRCGYHLRVRDLRARRGRHAFRHRRLHAGTRDRDRDRTRTRTRTIRSIGRRDSRSVGPRRPRRGSLEEPPPHRVRERTGNQPVPEEHR